MDDISQLDGAHWKGGLEMFNCMNSPWFKLLDPDKFERHVDRVQGLDLQVVASCHSPVIPRSKIDEAFTTIRGVVNLAPADLRKRDRRTRQVRIGDLRLPESVKGGSS